MNKFLCTGNLCDEPKKRETNNGKAVANFSIAVARLGGEGVDFFNVVVWGNQAENCAKYLKKGSKVGIVGTLQNRSYEANDGTKRTITEIVAEQVEFLTPKQAEETQEQVVSVKRERPQLEAIDDNQLPF
jgi:single-strand DNA-binding protein